MDTKQSPTGQPGALFFFLRWGGGGGGGERYQLSVSVSRPTQFNTNNLLTVKPNESYTFIRCYLLKKRPFLFQIFFFLKAS